MIRSLLLLALSACGLQETGGGAGLDFGTGTVWACEVEDASNQFAIVDLELCWRRGLGELESSLWVAYGNEEGEGFATCRATERHAGPCYWRCPGGWACNAFDGCWCPP